MGRKIGTAILAQKRATEAEITASRRAGDPREALEMLQAMASQGSAEAQKALSMCASGILIPGASPGQLDPQAMFESWKTDYMSAYGGAKPVSLESGIMKRYTGATEKSHLPVPPSGLGAIETLVDGEPQGGQAAQGYEVPFQHVTKAPQGLYINRKDMASDRVGMTTANVIAKGNDAAMMPDFRAADALLLAADPTNPQLSFDRVPVFSNQHVRNPVNPSIGLKMNNKFNENLDVNGLKNIVNAMSAYRNESNLPVVGGRIQFGIIVPPDLEGDLSYLLDRDRDQFGATNWAHIYDFVGISLPTLTDPKTYYVAILNGPVSALYFSVHIPMEHIFHGPGHEEYDKKRRFLFLSREDNVALIADWRMIAMSTIP
jgi:hypothetical protein